MEHPKMNKISHYINWEITRKDLQEIVRVIEEDIVVAFPITDTVEVILRKKKVTKGYHDVVKFYKEEEG